MNLRSLILFALLPACFLRAADAPFLVLEETKSPDGHYAVAWGLPTHPERWHPEEWTKPDPDEKSFMQIHDVESDVENYVVDVTNSRILHKLNSKYYVVGGAAPNRHQLEVAWSRKGDVALVNESFRWEGLSCCALRITNAHVIEVDLNQPFASKVRRHLKKRDELDVIFKGLEQLSETRWAATVDAVIGKSWTAGPLILFFDLKMSGASGLELQVAELRESRKEAGEVPGTKEHALISSDRFLNIAYRSLLAKLDADAKESLKAEQRAWLRERDRIGDDFNRASFVQKRAKELDSRARAISK